MLTSFMLSNQTAEGARYYGTDVGGPGNSGLVDP